MILIWNRILKKEKKNNEKALKDMKDNPNYNEYLNMVRKKFN
jgi:hypothetical protein